MKHAAAHPVRFGPPARWMQDPRHYQLVVLASALAYGIYVLDFPILAGHVVAVLAGCLGAQLVLSRLLLPGAVDLRSPLITALSLCLLLRVDTAAWAFAGGLLAIGSKFSLRWRSRHVFNPSALAIGVLVLGTGHAWVSPGQWGHLAMALLVMAGAGLLVLTRAGRLDIAAAFLACWSLILVLRAVSLGDPLSIAVHQMGNGALMLFAFFMITDPQTTPRQRSGRILYAACVSGVAAVLVFALYRADGLILSLVVCAPLVPLIDRFLPGRTHQWPPSTLAHSPTPTRSLS